MTWLKVLGSWRLLVVPPILILILVSYSAIMYLSPDSWHYNLNGLLGGESKTADLANLTTAELWELKKLLRAAEYNETVILTTLNQAWAEPNAMIDLFIKSFHLGYGTSPLLNHLVIINLDQAAYNRCKAIHRYCFLLYTPGLDFTGEKHFMTNDYLSMMWRRIEFLRVILQLGYNFVFTDTDVMWFRNPFQHFSLDADFEMACDRYNGDPNNILNRPNGGFLHVRSNPRTIEFYKYWFDSRHSYGNKHDQDVFNEIKWEPTFWDIGIKIRFLDTEFFGGFCEISRDLEKVCTIHANCCTGLERKLKDLRIVIEDWKHFQSMTLEGRKKNRMFWRAPRECLHSFGESI